jgi:drug/metabolite transporter (DMT)-like permease
LFCLQGRTSSQQFTGFSLALLGAILFSAKAVLAKLIYRQVSISVGEVLLFRMLFSLPFYLVIFLLARRKRTRMAKVEGLSPPPVSNYMYRKAIALGLLGYYVSSFFDFSGLQYISAGLERIILFSYPTMVLLFAATFYSTPVRRHQWLALALSYTGISVSFAADLGNAGSWEVLKGGMLILGCATTYALYVLWSGRLIPAMGSAYFTAVAMLAATGAVLLHAVLLGGPLHLLLSYPPQVYLLLLLMAVFSTVLPTLFISGALQRIGSGNVAIVSAIGPVATIALAGVFLGEHFGFMQLAGAGLVIAGVLIIGRQSLKSQDGSGELDA